MKRDDEQEDRSEDRMERFFPRNGNWAQNSHVSMGVQGAIQHVVVTLGGDETCLYCAG